MNKTLCGLVLAISIVACSPPVNRMEYRNSKNTISLVENFQGVPMLSTYYDVDGDGQYDVSELRIIEGVDEKSAYSNLEPIIYGFDLDQDRFFGIGEVLYDEAMDGLNGNEVPLEEMKGVSL